VFISPDGGLRLARRGPQRLRRSPSSCWST